MANKTPQAQAVHKPTKMETGMTPLRFRSQWPQCVGCWDADATPPLMLFDMEGCNIVIDLYIIIYIWLYIKLWLYIYDYIYMYVCMYLSIYVSMYLSIYVCMYVCIDIARWPVKVVIKTASFFDNTAGHHLFRWTAPSSVGILLACLMSILYPSFNGDSMAI